MKYINGLYTQHFNRRHGRVGHVFQGRYKSILVESDPYLLELARYIVLNPVRARMVRSAKDWPWSSYQATAGMKEVEICLETDWVLSEFGERKQMAQEGYQRFVQQGKGQPEPWEHIKNQIYLGSDQFVENMQSKLDPQQSLKDIPKPQKQASPKLLSYYQNKYSDRNEAMAEAYRSGHYTLLQVGDHFGVSYATVSRAFKVLEENVKCKA